MLERMRGTQTQTENRSELGHTEHWNQRPGFRAGSRVYVNWEVSEVCKCFHGVATMPGHLAKAGLVLANMGN